MASKQDNDGEDTAPAETIFSLFECRYPDLAKRLLARYDRLLEEARAGRLVTARDLLHTAIQELSERDPEFWNRTMSYDRLCHMCNTALYFRFRRLLRRRGIEQKHLGALRGLFEELSQQYGFPDIEGDETETSG